MAQEGCHIRGVLFKPLIWSIIPTGYLWCVSAILVAIYKFEGGIQVVDHGIPDQLSTGSILGCGVVVPPGETHRPWKAQNQVLSSIATNLTKANIKQVGKIGIRRGLRGRQRIQCAFTDSL